MSISCPSYIRIDIVPGYLYRVSDSILFLVCEHLCHIQHGPAVLMPMEFDQLDTHPQMFSTHKHRRVTKYILSLKIHDSHVDRCHSHQSDDSYEKSNKNKCDSFMHTVRNCTLFICPRYLVECSPCDGRRNLLFFLLMILSWLFTTAKRLTAVFFFQTASHVSMWVWVREWKHIWWHTSKRGVFDVVYRKAILGPDK